MLKYLRIAVTALCLTACVLLFALWVRSYWRLDTAYGPRTPSRLSWFASSSGQLIWADYPKREFNQLGWFVPSEWSFNTQRLNYFERRRNETDFLGFRVSTTTGGKIVGGFLVIVPYWFPVVSPLVFTSLLWPASARRGLRTLLNLRLDPKRLKPRFSLGALIILMTALAGIMTLVAAYLQE